MSERRREEGEELDLAMIARDDAILDALGRDEAVPDGDLLTEMLATWRADVAGPTDGTTTLADVAGPTDGTTTLAGHHGGRTRTAVPAGAPLPSARPGRSRPLPRRAMRLAAAVVAALVLATGLGVGSRNAGPTSPLWSLTKVLHPQRAEVSSVEHSIAQARDATAAGRLDEARQLIARAQRELDRVTDPTDAARLRAEVDAVLRDLAAPACPTWPRCGSTPVSPAPTPAASTAGRPPSTAPTRPPAAPAPTPRTRADPVPSLPGLPAPPLPSPSVLPSLPGLPLPTAGPLG